MMALVGPLDIAQIAILRVAHIASVLGVHNKRAILGRLGAELMLVADYLNTSELDDEERLRSRVSKLMRDVEMLCSVSRHERAQGARLPGQCGKILPLHNPSGFSARFTLSNEES
jgi:hypothetical protein